MATEQRIPRSPLRSSGGYVPSYPQTAFKPETPSRTFMEPIPMRPSPHADDMILKIETL